MKFLFFLKTSFGREVPSQNVQPNQLCNNRACKTMHSGNERAGPYNSYSLQPYNGRYVINRNIARTFPSSWEEGSFIFGSHFRLLLIAWILKIVNYCSFCSKQNCYLLKISVTRLSLEKNLRNKKLEMQTQEIVALSTSPGRTNKITEIVCIRKLNTS